MPELICNHLLQINHSYGTNLQFFFSQSHGYSHRIAIAKSIIHYKSSKLLSPNMNPDPLYSLNFVLWLLCDLAAI